MDGDAGTLLDRIDAEARKHFGYAGRVRPPADDDGLPGLNTARLMAQDKSSQVNSR